MILIGQMEDVNQHPASRPIDGTNSEISGTPPNKQRPRQAVVIIALDWRGSFLTVRLVGKIHV